MEGAITLIVLLLIAVLIIPLILAFSSNAKLNTLLESVKDINLQLKNLKKELEQVKSNSQLEEDAKNEIVRKEWISEIKPETIPLIETIKEEEPILEKITEKEWIQEEELVIKSEIPSPIIQESKIKKGSKQAKSINWEKFIGEKLVSIVGIAILVLGIFFIVKWANSRNLISDGVKIILGLLSATILIAVAHKLSQKYRAFSSILAGGGIAVLYFSIYEAYQAYHLIPQNGAFFAMIAVTVFAVVLSIMYDKKELAVIAIIGGFCTPFFVSNGAGNYQILFTYLIILNLGMFALAYYKKWNLINVLSYIFTFIIFGSWMFKEYEAGQTHPKNGFLFASILYLIFFGMNIIYNVRNNSKFKALEFSLLLSNTFAYFGVGLFFLKYLSEGASQGAFTAALSIFNFVFAYFFYKQNKVDKNLIYLLIGLVLTFVSLIAPIQLNGNYITLFWACEMVLLFWLGHKSKLEIIKTASIIVMIMCNVSLILDWNQNYAAVHINKYAIVFNKAFITGIIVVLASIMKLRMLKNDDSESYVWNLLPKKNYNVSLGIIICTLVFAVGYLEQNYQVKHIFKHIYFSQMSNWVYYYMFTLALVLLGKFKKWDSIYQRGTLILSSLAVVLYPLANNSITLFRNETLVHQNMKLQLAIHILIPFIALILIINIVQYIKQNYDSEQQLTKISAWLLTFAFVFIISAESIHIWTIMNYEQGFSIEGNITKAIKVIWPILWSITSLTLMVLGMRHKIKNLRIISLTLFAITIVKLFTYDISNVSSGGKIAAFLILGVVLLLVSFLYQRIKGIFIEDETQLENNN